MTEYRGYVHKEPLPESGHWICAFIQIEDNRRTILALDSRPTQRSAFLWAADQVRDAYDSISLTPSKNPHGVRLPRHCLWCGKLTRYEADRSYCTGHKSKARKNRATFPYLKDQCRTPAKATYDHRGTAIMTARLLDLDCYQCDNGCNAYHLTSQERGILTSINRSKVGGGGASSTPAPAR